MAWSSVAPDVSKSVKTNGPILQGNTAYTETTMNKDHFWNIGADEDGHHQYVQMPKNGGATPADVTPATGMNAALYAKQKTSTEQPGAFQAIEAFMKVSSTGVTYDVLQMLGIRAACVFGVALGVATPVYSHNVTVARTSTGVFTATFTAALPSANYLVLGGLVRNDSSPQNVGYFTVSGASTLSAVKSTASFQFRTFDYSSTFAHTDPLQCWFVCFGG